MKSIESPDPTSLLARLMSGLIVLILAGGVVSIVQGVVLLGRGSPAGSVFVNVGIDGLFSALIVAALQSILVRVVRMEAIIAPRPRAAGAALVRDPRPAGHTGAFLVQYRRSDGKVEECEVFAASAGDARSKVLARGHVVLGVELS